MLKTPLMFATLPVLAFAMPAAAQEKSRSTSYDGPHVSASQTTTVNRDTGTATRDREVTSTATGNTASGSAVRQRTEDGSTIDIVQTGPQGRSRSLEGTRARSENGASFTGTATGRRGETYGLQGSRSRDGDGNSAARQSVTNSAGETLAARERVTTRSDGQVSRSVSRTRADGARRPSRARRPRG